MNYDALRAELMRDEGVRRFPYRCTAGRLTIGVGRNLDDVGITDAEARVLLDNDIARIAGELAGAFPWFAALDDGRQRALVNMGFNLGLPRLAKFRRMLAALAAGRFDEAADHALASRWAVQVGPGRAGRVAQLLRTGHP